MVSGVGHIRQGFKLKGVRLYTIRCDEVAKEWDATLLIMKLLRVELNV